MNQIMENDEHFPTLEDFTNQPVRDEMIASLQLVGDNLDGHKSTDDCPLLAIDMFKDLVAAGDRVLVYNHIEAHVVLVTKTRDLIIEIDKQWYWCGAYNVNVDRLKAL